MNKIPFIENISLADVIKGKHKGKDVLIRIIDPDMKFSDTAHKFKEEYRFQFLDLEDTLDPINDNLKISDIQAEEIYNILKKSFIENKNVTVHCVMGVCRSGAVAEVGNKMGFYINPNTYRNPNLRVKHKLMLCLMADLVNKKEN